MNDSSYSEPSTNAARAPRTGRRRATALVLGGVLLFAGGAGTGAVVGTALSPAAASTSQGGPGGAPGMGQPPSGQMPGGGQSGQDQSGSGQSGTGQSGQAPQAPTGTAPSTAPSTSAS